MLGTMTNIGRLLFVIALLGSGVFIIEAKRDAASINENRIRSNRVKRSTIIYDIYSLDYFIELVEKIERHSKTVGAGVNLRGVANYIRKLGYDNDLWTQLCGTSDLPPDDILNVEEKRVLTNMIKHSFDDTTRQELGIVITPDDATVAMGRVITGICAGLNRDKSLSLKTWTSGATQSVDNLYAATIAYDLGESSLSYQNGSISVLFGPSGSWSPNTECPEVYRLNMSWSQATDAEILGDIDGFLLGYDVPLWENRGVRLGQLLRMYYGSGVLYETSYASCHRNVKFRSIVAEEDLFYQLKGFSHAYYAKYSSALPNLGNDDITSLARDTTQEFYTYFDQITGDGTCNTDGNNEECELPANIVFVMDESGSIRSQNYDKEKTFVSEIIKDFDVSPTQARVAIVEYSTDARLSVGLDTYASKTRLLCAVSNLRYSQGSTYTAKALQLVNDNILRPAQDNPMTSTETVQLVIVMTDGKSSDKYALEHAVKDLKTGISDLTMIAVGIADYNLAELELISTDKKEHVFTATSFDQLLKLVGSLRRKACTAPVYMGLNFTHDGDTTEVVAYVSPKKARFFTLQAEHFFGLEDIYIDVLPQYGTVSVFASRITDTPGPDNYSLKVGPAGKGEELQLHFTDLCVGYNSSDTCPSINIGIYGASSTLSCAEQECNLPNQIKFRIRRGTPAATGGATTKETHAIIMSLTLILALHFFRPSISVI